MLHDINNRGEVVGDGRRDGDATVAGTATPGLDSTAVEGTLTFAKTQKSKTVTVFIKRDHRDEANETFTLQLSRPVTAHIADGTGIGTIRDDD